MRNLKNITITLEQEVDQWIRVWAARHQVSVSRMVGELLRQYMQEERGYETAMNQYLARRPAVLTQSGAYPSREQLHERDRLR